MEAKEEKKKSIESQFWMMFIKISQESNCFTADNSQPLAINDQRNKTSNNDGSLRNQRQYQN